MRMRISCLPKNPANSLAKALPILVTLGQRVSRQHGTGTSWGGDLGAGKWPVDVQHASDVGSLKIIRARRGVWTLEWSGAGRGDLFVLFR